jgi:pyridoxal phosphate enzyme (YggS family)
LTDYSYIDRNVERVRSKIEKAAREIGRDPDEITLLAAIKYADEGEIKRLYDCGIRFVGENRVQQFDEHREIDGFDRFHVHFIGTLQTNKVKYLVGNVDIIESVDSERLAEEIDRMSKKKGIVTDVLCEINCGREPNKSGVLPEDAEELCEKIKGLSGIRLRGFMTMAPFGSSSDEYRKYFEETYRLSLDIWRKTIHNIGEDPIMSMGMSGSFEEAILEGANVVRVGRTLFEKN